MKNTLTALLIIVICTSYSFAETKHRESSIEDVKIEAEKKQPEHLLDGTSMKYYYQNGGGIHIELYNGKLKYEWITGPRKGHKNQDLKYRSRKIGDKLYMVSWLEESHPDYTTLIFNFNNNVMYSSGIFRFGTKNQFIRFNGGIIENLVLVEK